MIVPVILSGGSGSRLWPLSRALYPKQLLPLTGDEESAAYAINRDGVVVGWSQHRITGPDPRPGGNPAPIITDGLLVLVQDVMAAITTAPCPIS